MIGGLQMAKASKKKVTPRAIPRRSARYVEEKHIGTEIVNWDSVSDIKTAANECLRHYGYFYGPKDSVKWALAWMKGKKYTPTKIKKFKAPSHNFFSMTAGSLCKMAMNGFPLDKKSLALVEKSIDEQIERGDAILKSKKKDTPKDVVRKSPADIVKEKTSDIIAEIECIVDEYDHRNHKEHIKWTVYALLDTHEAAYNTAKAVHDYYLPLANELNELYSKKTEDLVEAYGWLGVHGRKRYMDFIQKIIDDAESYMNAKKAVRKPRKKKVKSAGAQTAKVQYLKEDKDLKIASLPPEKIIGATVIYLYSVKYRKMTVLHTNSVKGFEVKGTTVQNIDLEVSYTKILRKPEEFLKTFMKTTKAKAKKDLKALKTKEGAATGRINGDTIILRMFK